MPGLFPRKEAQQRFVSLFWTLELRHMPAFELEVLGMRQRLPDMSGEPDRDDRVPAAPNEQARRLQAWQPGPEPVRSARLLEVDVSGRGVERGTASRGQVGA